MSAASRVHSAPCGYPGYCTDPDGHLWEVAWGAFDVNEDGSLRVG
jgi:hypothetical protein